MSAIEEAFGVPAGPLAAAGAREREGSSPFLQPPSFRRSTGRSAA